MPKDPKKNVNNYKIRGGDINEYEYDQNQQAVSDKPPKKPAKKSAKTAKKT